jgi:Aminotransferase class-V
MSVPGLRREDFPAFDRFTYLNTASTGLVPAAVLQPAHEFEAELAQAGTTGMDEDTEVGILEDARNAAAELLHTDPSTIGIATSFPEALCQVAWWLRPGSGQNVVSSDADFPSVTYPWHRIAEDTGCQVRLVSVLDDPGGFDVDKIAGQVDSATAAICISHIQYLTGHLLDLNDLAALAHDRGALLIIDATQSAGQVPNDVTATGVDVLITGSYKWLCSLFGAAACYLSPASWRPPAAVRRMAQHRAPLRPGRPVAAAGEHRAADGVLHHVLCGGDRARPRHPLHHHDVAGGGSHPHRRTCQPGCRGAGAAGRETAHPRRPGTAGRDGHRPVPGPRRRGRRRRAHPPRGDRLPPGRLHPVLYALLQQQRRHLPSARHAGRGAPVTATPAAGRQ